MVSLRSPQYKGYRLTYLLISAFLLIISLFVFPARAEVKRDDSNQQYYEKAKRFYLHLGWHSIEGAPEEIDDFHKRYWNPLNVVLSALDKKQIGDGQLADLFKQVGDVTKNLPQDTFPLADTLQAHFKESFGGKSPTMEDIRGYLDDLEEASKKIKALPDEDKKSLANFTGSEDYKNGQGKVVIVEKGQFAGIRLTKKDGTQLLYKPGNNDAAPTLYDIRDGKIYPKSKWSENGWTELKNILPDSNKLAIPRRTPRFADVRPDAARVPGEAAPGLWARGRAIRNVALRNIAPLTIKSDKSQVKEGEYYWDKDTKFLRDKEGNAVGYKAVGMKGGYFFFGKDSPPDAKGTATDRTLWALYSSEGRFLAFYDGPGTNVSLSNRPKKGTPITGLESEQQAHFRQLGIKDGDAVTRLDLGQNLWTLKVDGEEVKAFRLQDSVRKAKTGNAILDGAGEYVALDGKIYSFAKGRDGLYRTVRVDKREAPAPKSEKIDQSPPPVPGKEKPNKSSKEDDKPVPPADAKPETTDKNPQPAPAGESSASGGNGSNAEPKGTGKTPAVKPASPETQKITRIYAISRIDATTPGALGLLKAALASKDLDSGMRSLVVDKLFRIPGGQKYLIEELGKAKDAQLFGLVSSRWASWDSSLGKEALLASAQNTNVAVRVAAAKALPGALAQLSKDDKVLAMVNRLALDKDPEVASAALESLKSMGQKINVYLPIDSPARKGLISTFGHVLASQEEVFSQMWEDKNAEVRGEMAQTLAAIVSPKEKRAIFELVYLARSPDSPVAGNQPLQQGIAGAAKSMEGRKDIQLAVQLAMKYLGKEDGDDKAIKNIGGAAPNDSNKNLFLVARENQFLEDPGPGIMSWIRPWLPW